MVQPARWGPSGLSCHSMPRPLAERQSLEQERQELLVRLAGYHTELDTLPADAQQRREWLDWQVRRAQKRMAYLEARLASMVAGE